MDSPLKGDGFEPSVPRRGTAFFETPVRAFGARPSAREEIGPAEKERPFRGGRGRPDRYGRAVELLFKHQS
jgi:hypothetical protein